MAYIEGGGDWNLRDVPTQPPGFLDIMRLNNESQGFYIVGHDKFFGANFTISNIIHRQLGSSDEIALGILSVFLIATFAELVQTVLLRTGRDRRLIAKSFLYAMMVDEVSHFHSVWTYFREGKKKSRVAAAFSQRKNQVITSIVILSLMLFVFVSEVLAVIITQPLEIRSRETEFNLQGLHPSGCSRGNAKFIKRIVLEQGCVTPVILQATSRRNFNILVCFSLEKTEALTNDNDEIGEITVGSWYHRGGFNHNVTFGDAKLHVGMRARFLPNVPLEGPEEKNVNKSARRIMFKSLDTKDMAHAFYIQQRFIYAAVEINCNKHNADCPKLVKAVTPVSRRRNSRVRLWETKTEVVYEDVAGLETTFRVPIVDPFQTLFDALGDLITSATIREVNDVAEYERVTDDVQEFGVKGLMTEGGRIAGVLLVSIILVCFIFVLVILRHLCRPISLASIAVSQLFNGSLVQSDNGSDDPVDQPGAQGNENGSNSVGHAERYSQSSEAEEDV